MARIGAGIWNALDCRKDVLPVSVRNVEATLKGLQIKVAGAAKAQMPPEALLGVMSVVRPHLDDKGWAKLAAAIGIDPGLGRG